ncbi:isoprenylcysteine carboxylmethyltransferase family protein [Luedemannella flava]|uniref:Isoprenylcysteine carboxylmethyltransferase family protein n=1 Tax=Luedemannella flava TaxID=349316 RepID=A0ABN2LDU5_9ACTN
MRQLSAALGSAAFFVAAPGTVVGLGPWFVTRWRLPDPDTYPVALMVLGGVLIVVGLIPPVAAFARFARAGGTPMPAAPTTHLVVAGFNRYVRNPMYAGLLVVIVGQALLFARWELILYAGFFWAVTAAFVRWYEEPTLAQQYGAEYEAYRLAVPAWIPRVPPRRG